MHRHLDRERGAVKTKLEASWRALDPKTGLPVAGELGEWFVALTTDLVGDPVKDAESRARAVAAAEVWEREDWNNGPGRLNYAIKARIREVPALPYYVPDDAT